MQLSDTKLHGVKLIQPKRHGDYRGWFAEIFNASAYEHAGLPSTFVQDNQSSSARGVLRGLHYQLDQPQGKLVRVLSGHIWDVVLDLRRASPTFGQWAAFDLRPRSPSGELEMLWIPEGFAHGFLVLSETAEILYKTTRLYSPTGERCILWNDPALAIPWPLDQLNGAPPTLSPKDTQATPFANAELP